MPEPRRSSTTAIVGIALVVLLAGYVWAYYGIVEVLPEWSYVPGTPGAP